jgi:hypothetical protein
MADLEMGELYTYFFLTMGLSQQIRGPQAGHSSSVQPLVTVTSISQSGWSQAYTSPFLYATKDSHLFKLGNEEGPLAL